MTLINLLMVGVFPAVLPVFCPTSGHNLCPDTTMEWVVGLLGLWEFVAILSALKVLFFVRFRVHFRLALKYILIYVDL